MAGIEQTNEDHAELISAARDQAAGMIACTIVCGAIGSGVLVIIAVLAWYGVL